jgi:hypothetical protein
MGSIMNARYAFVRHGLPSYGTAFFLLMVVGLSTAFVRAEGPRGAPQAQPEKAQPAEQTSLRPPSGSPLPGLSFSSLLAESWWGRLSGPLESGLTSRARMIQFGALMMLLALWVIWWRK